MFYMAFDKMDPFRESLLDFNAHVAAWKWWYQSEGRHFDNGLRHADHQLIEPPINAQCAPRSLED